MMGRVMIVDCDCSFLEKIPELLHNPELILETFTNGFDALHEIKHENPDLILIGTDLSGLTAIQLTALLRLSCETKDIPVILLTDGWMDDELLRESRICRIRKWLKKPLDASELSDSVNAALLEHEHDKKKGEISAQSGI